MRLGKRSLSSGVPWICFLLIWGEPAMLAPPNTQSKKHPSSATTQFHHAVLISTGGSFRINPDSEVCIDPLAVLLAHETFFERLTRVRGPTDSEWRYFRDGARVDEFPESVLVEVFAVPSNCSERDRMNGHPIWNEELREFMGSLYFQFRWLKVDEATRAQIVSARTEELPWQPGVGHRAPQWRYYLEIESGKIPITDSLSVEIFSGDGRQLTRVISGMERASPWP